MSKSTYLRAGRKVLENLEHVLVLKGDGLYTRLRGGLVAVGDGKSEGLVSGDVLPTERSTNLSDILVSGVQNILHNGSGHNLVGLLQSSSDNWERKRRKFRGW